MNVEKIAGKEGWLAERLQLLVKEKELTRMRDEVSRQRRALPWVEITKPYKFVDTDGDYTLPDLFGDHSQLVIYHFMFGADWDVGCKSCSFWADNFNGIDIHLAHRDISFLAVSSAPIDKLQAFKRRMDWSFRWLSVSESDFNRDYYVSFTAEQKATGEKYYNYKLQPWFTDEMVGVSVFVKNDQQRVYHSYSTYGCGVDILNSAYNFIDLTPKGRDEGDGIQNWVRLHDEYD